MKYSKDFKEEALKLSDEIGVKKAAGQLGLPYYTLSDWRNKRKSEKKRPRLPETEAEKRIRELEKENAELKTANATLSRCATKLDSITNIANTILARDFKSYGNQSMNGVIELNSKQIIQVGNVCPTKNRSNPNQGRVYDPSGISPSLNCKSGGNLEPHILDENLRCRKYTPLECFRLMGFTDEDFYRVRQALMDAFYNGKDRANSQLYKLAGNSISVPLLEYLFCQIFDDQNKLWI